MKKWKVMLATGILFFSCAGCGGQDGKNTGIPSDGAENEIKYNIIEDDTPAYEVTEEEAEEKNDAASDLQAKTEQGEAAAFAERIKSAMEDKDLGSLADLCSYPLAVEGEVIESRDLFMELNGSTIFTDERCDVIAAVDTSALEETMAGIIMGEGVPNIIFQSVDGTLGITGIN